MIGKMTGIILLCTVCAFGNGDVLYKQGAGLFKSDPVQALELFEQAAGEGSVPAMVGAGHCYETGTGTQTDYAKAIAFYELAVQNNSLKACEGLAHIYAVCPDPEFHDGVKAVKFAGAIARKKPRDFGALALLAKAHARNMDFSEAGKMLLKAKRVADHEQLPELKRLQQNFEKGIPEPEQASEVWMMKAGDEGRSLWAMLQIAGWCSTEAHTMHDQKQARMWYARSSKMGSAEGALQYGRFCLRGIGGAVDIESAIAAFENAAEAGELQAFSYLGEIYFSNRTGRRDMDKAYKYYSRLEGTEDQTIEFLIQALKSSKLRSRMDGAEPEELHTSGDQYSIPSTYTTYDIYGNSSGTVTIPARHNYALIYYLAAAESGFRPAMLKVASIYKRGNTTVHADPKRAEYWAKQLGMKSGDLVAAAKIVTPRDPSGIPNNARVLNQEARKYRGLDGYPKDPSLEFRLYMKSYEVDPSESDGYAAFAISCIYFRGCEEVPMDKEKALEWKIKAADQGHPESLVNLVARYAMGNVGAECDAERAMHYALKLLKEEERASRDYRYFDVIGAAYARNGDFMNAVKYQNKAIEALLSKDSRINQSEKSKQRKHQEMLSRIELYQAGQPFKY
ncbi:hypothetical protein P4B35_04355 [Pontiellaceae bacterium B12227]|nr:hypothetical protein [Pontiellaceae bacterium B12227]